MLIREIKTDSTPLLEVLTSMSQRITIAHSFLCHADPRRGGIYANPSKKIYLRKINTFPFCS